MRQLGGQAVPLELKNTIEDISYNSMVQLVALFDIIADLCLSYFAFLN